MSTSTQSTAENALLALMLADATLQAVGPPQIFTPTAMKKEHVWISENSEETQVAAVTGGIGATISRDEFYDLHVIVSIEKLGDDYVQVRDRGVALVAALENLVRSNVTLLGAVFSAQVTAIERRSGAAERQRWVDHMVTVSCRAVLVGP